MNHAFRAVLLLSLLGVAFHWLWNLGVDNSNGEGFLPFTHKCLIVVAHPDDETMFFAPTILRLVEAGSTPHLLSITSGNATGQGRVRVQEWARAVSKLGVPFRQAAILDEEAFQDGHVKWDIPRLSRLVADHINRLNCNCVVTFDEWGVSQHPNHIDCYKSVKRLADRNGNVHFYSLVSVSLWRKYTSMLDILIRHKADPSTPLALNPNPMRVYQAMWEYQTQLVWYRYLYIAMSRYVWINELLPMSAYDQQ